MTDAVKTCANCGNTQTSGEFCEKCGTRMPAAYAPAGTAAPGVGTTAGAATAAGMAAGAGSAAFSEARPSAPPPPMTPPPYAQQQYSPPPPGYGPPNHQYSGSKGFFGRLFDFSFQEFITPSIIKVLFIISIVVIGLGFLGGVIFGFAASPGAGVLFLIGGLIYSFLMLLYARVMLEIFIVFFRIQDNTEEIAKGKR